MTTEDCLFCQILAGDIAADIIYESDDAIGFRDINPQAPTHVLIVPRQHIATINDLTDEDRDTIGKLFMAAQWIAKDEGLTDDGYRTVINCNAAAGQSVFHIHLHLLGGRQMSWPPG